MTNFPKTDTEFKAWLAMNVLDAKKDGGDLPVMIDGKQAYLAWKGVPKPIWWIVYRNDKGEAFHAVPFNPLHLHNDMAMVRAKMFEEHWCYVKSFDGLQHWVAYQKPQMSLSSKECSSPDELRAEAEAIFNAKSEDQPHD